jgi:hypothetical protein
MHWRVARRPLVPFDDDEIDVAAATDEPNAIVIGVEIGSVKLVLA